MTLIRVGNNYDVSPRLIETFNDRLGKAGVSGARYQTDGKEGRHLLDDLTGLIRRVVVHNQNFERDIRALQDIVYFIKRRSDYFLLTKGWDDNGKIKTHVKRWDDKVL